MVKKILTLTVASLLGALFFLDFSPIGQKIRIQKEDGVEVIYNPKNPPPPPGSPTKLILEEVFTLGQEKEGEVPFSQLAGFTVDSKERVFVLDSKESEVKVFDNHGQFLFKFGRPGQGPGELNNPIGIHLTPKGEILIEDALNQRLSLFSPEGKFIKSISTAKLLGLSGIVLDSRGNFVARQMVMAGNNLKWEIKKYNVELEPLYTVASIAFPNPLEGKINPFQFIVIYKIGPFDNLYYGEISKYEIKVFNPEGKLIRKILKEYDPVKISEEDKKKMLAQIPEEANALKDRLVFPEYYPPYQSFSFDDEGRLFVNTFEKGKNKGEYYFDIFDQQGRYIAKIPLKVVPSYWQNKKVYALETIEEGYNLLHCFRFTWKS